MVPGNYCRSKLCQLNPNKRGSMTAASSNRSLNDRDLHGKYKSINSRHFLDLSPEMKSIFVCQLKRKECKNLTKNVDHDQFPIVEVFGCGGQLPSLFHIQYSFHTFSNDWSFSNLPC